MGDRREVRDRVELDLDTAGWMWLRWSIGKAEVVEMEQVGNGDRAKLLCKTKSPKVQLAIIQKSENVHKFPKNVQKSPLKCPLKQPKIPQNVNKLKFLFSKMFTKI